MNKRKILMQIPKLMAWEARGNFWVSFIEGFFNWQNLLMQGGMIKLLFPTIPFWVIAVFGIILGFGYKMIKIFIIGQWDYKRGIWKIMAEWNQKDKTINPFNDELVETLKVICDKLGVEHKFKDL